MNGFTSLSNSEQYRYSQTPNISGRHQMEDLIFRNVYPILLNQYEQIKNEFQLATVNGTMTNELRVRYKEIKDIRNKRIDVILRWMYDNEMM